MKRKYANIIDRKSGITYFVLNLINTISVGDHFARLEIQGLDRLPDGPYILIANHSSRWDGPIVQQVIQRPANYMVSPTELKGLQGLLLRAIGAFPADPRADLLPFMRKQVSRKEPIVIFPEGDVYRDGSTHQFKKGAARIALLCASENLDVPVVPMAISYSRTRPEIVRVLIGDSIDVADRIGAYRQKPIQTMHTLSLQLHREVCHLRAELGSIKDRETVFEGKPVRSWAHHALM